MEPKRTRVRAALPLALPLLLVSGACTSTPYLEPDPYRAEQAGEPEWRWMPHSWEKLDAIETWLVGAGPRVHPELVAEAELLLAEGRLRFAEEEAGVLTANAIQARVSAAESGLRRVLADPFADESIKSRARRALGDLQGVRTGGTVARVTGVLPRNGWGARVENRRRLTPSSGRWSRITVHHSAMEAGPQGRSSQSASGYTVAGTQEHHIDANGWGDIGYHFLIDPDGRIYAGRGLQWQGAHAGGADGANNVENIGVCLLGNFQAERPTARAVASLQRLLDDLRDRFGIPLAAVTGHQHFKNTACPGRYLQPWVDAYSSGRSSGAGSWPTRARAAAPRGSSAALAARPTRSPAWSRDSGGGRVR